MSRPSPLCSRRIAHLRTVLLAFLLASCDWHDEWPTGASTAPPDIRAYVTGLAAEHLNAEGRFQLLPVTASGDRPIITPERARALAEAFLRSYGPFFESSWGKERGSSIHVTHLRAESSVFLAETPYEPFPRGNYHPAFPKMFGPYYLVTFTADRVEQLIVAVSAYNTDVEIDSRGDVRLPAVGGDEFLTEGVPDRAPQSHRPENAVAAVGRRTGARTEVVPQLVLPGVNPRNGLDYHPAAALWRLRLDRDVVVRRRGQASAQAVRELYVGPDGRTFIPAANRAAVRTIAPVPVGPPWGRNASRVTVELPVRPGHAGEFEEVTPDASGR